MACVSHNVKGLKSLACLLTVKLKKRENKLTVAYARYLTDVKYFVCLLCKLTMAYAWYLTDVKYFVRTFHVLTVAYARCLLK